MAEKDVVIAIADGIVLVIPMLGFAYVAVWLGFAFVACTYGAYENESDLSFYLAAIAISGLWGIVVSVALVMGPPILLGKLLRWIRGK